MFLLFLQTEHWIKDGNNLLINLGRKVTECRSPKEAEELINKMNKFVEEGKPKNDQRLNKISELAIELYGKIFDTLIFQYLTEQLLIG